MGWGILVAVGCMVDIMVVAVEPACERTQVSINFEVVNKITVCKGTIYIKGLVIRK